jgi:hypothetical protein
MPVPGAPNIFIRPRALLTSLVLYWNPPIDTGDSPIESYTIRSTEASFEQTYSSNTRKVTIGSLTNGINYTFTITATNGTGEGPAATYRTVQVGLLPSNPTNVVINNTTSTTANIQWDFSAGAGQAPTKWFVLKGIPSTVGIAPIVVKSAHGTERGRIIKNLSTSITYSFLVQAVNDVGYTPVNIDSESDYIQIGGSGLPPLDPVVIPGLVFYADMSVLSSGVITSIPNQLPADEITTTITLSGTGTIIANGLNTQNVLSMTTSNVLTGTTLNLPNFTIFTVAKRNSSTGLVFNDGADNAYGYLANNVGGINLQDATNTINSPGTAWTTPTWDIQTLSQFTDINGVNLNFNWNGTPQLTQTSATYAQYETKLTQLNINSATDPSECVIAEILIFDSALTLYEIQLIEGYLASKWNLTANLPQGHPYKLASPSDITPLYWSPTKLPGCQLWLDAADTESIERIGTAVTQWNDKSGNGNDATGSATYDNNKLVFNGSSSYLDTTYTANSANETVFIVMKLSNVSSAQDIISGTTTGDRKYVYNSTAFSLGKIGGSQITDTLAPTINKTYLLEYTANSANNTDFYANGLSTTSNFSLLTYSGSGITTIGYNGNGTNNYLNGSISEIIIYNRVISESERQITEGYLSWKWGLLTSLIQSHPYTYNAPIMTVADVFTPTSIKNCVMWVDARDPLNNGTLPNNNTSINIWYDKSGLNNHLRRIGSLNMPTLSTTGINNLPSINFTNGTGLNTNNVKKSENVTMLWVGKLSTTTTDLSGTLWGHYTTGNANTDIQLRRNGTTSTVSWRTNNDDISGNIIGAINSPVLYSCTMSQGVNLFIQQTNSTGTISTKYTEVSKTWTAGNAPIRVGLSDTSRAFNGHVSEILYYQRILSPIERQAAEGYLAWKWGLENYLPETHLFRNEKPKANEPLSWNPNNLPNLGFWLDGLDINNNNANIAAGATVTQWKDKSTNLANATGDSSVTMPIAQIGGGVVFANTGTQMTFSAGNYPQLGANGTFFFVTTPSTLPTTYLYASSNTSGIIMNFAPNAVATFNMAANDGGIVADTDITEKMLFNVTRKTNTFMNAYFMGSPTILTDNPILTVNSSQNIFTLGSATGSNYFGGTIYEVLFYNYALTDSERQVVEGYLAWKWNIQLASSHPFFLNPPTPNERPVTWKPTNLTGLNLWIDGLDFKSLVKADGTPGKALQVIDKSINKNHMRQKTGIINVNTALFSDLTTMSLSNTYLVGTINPSITTKNLSAFAVATMNNSTASFGRIFGLGGANNDNDNDGSAVLFGRNNSTNALITNRNTQQLSVSVPSYDTPFLIYSSQQPNNSYIGINGQLTPNTSATGISADFNISNYAMGSNLSSGDTDGYYTGAIGEVILTSSVLQTGERQGVEGYLSWKWGLQSTLPSAHPYRSKAPTFNQMLKWLPSNIPALQFWYDASDLKYRNGEVIDMWTDSAITSTVVPPTNFKQPTLSKKVLNELSVATFSTTQSLSIGPNLPNSKFSFFAVSRQTGGTNARVFSSSESGTNIAIGYRDGQKQVLKINNEVNITSVVNSDTNWDIVNFSTRRNTAGTTGILTNPIDVAYNSTLNRYVMVGHNADNTICIVTSTDGINWVASNNNPFSGGQGNSVACNNSTWVAVGYNLDLTVTIATSTNGLDWTPNATNYFSVSANAVANNGTYFLVSGSDSSEDANVIMKSTTGTSWTAVTDSGPFIDFPKSFAWNSSQSKWMAISSSVIGVSTDGETWTSITGPSGVDIAVWYALGSNNTYWLVNFYDNTSASNQIWKTADGTTWTQAENYPFTTTPCSRFVWNGAYWIATSANTSNNDPVSAKSSDGLNWTSTNNNPLFEISITVNSVTYNNNNSSWIIVGANGGGGLYASIIYVISYDGINWIVPTVDGLPFYNFYWNGTSLASGYFVSTITNIQINGQYANNEYSNCQIAEVICYNGTLMTEERQLVEGYLAHKWGLQANLPSIHPYKSTRPTLQTQITWLPTALANTGLWLDGSDPINNSQSIIADGSSLNVWVDKFPIPKISTVIEPDSIYESVFVKHNVANGRQAARFNDSHLKVKYNVFPNTYTIFALPYLNNNDGYATASAILIKDPTNNFLYRYSDYIYIFGESGKINVPDIYATNRWAISCATSNRSYVSLYLNGINFYYNLLQTTLITSPTELLIGGPPVSAPANDNYFHGDISEIIIFEYILPDTERQIVEGYLAWKYSINDLLPIYHPFYNKMPNPNTPSYGFSAGLQLWLESDVALSNLTIVENVVVEWIDKSGNQNNTTGIVGTPTYNDLSGVVFDGFSYFNLPNGAIPFGNSSYTIYLIVTMNDLTASRGILGAGDVNNYLDISNYTTDQEVSPNTIGLQTIWGPAGNTAVFTDPTLAGTPLIYTTKYLATGLLQSSEPLLQSYLNGTQDQATNIIATEARNQSNTSNTLGKVHGLSNMQGVISEVLVYNCFHDDLQQQTIEGYLAWKWGLEANLPSAHLFANVQPIMNAVVDSNFFVGCGIGPNSLSYSYDGISWKSALTNPFKYGVAKDVAYNGSYWVAVGSSSDNSIHIVKSTDGINWYTSTNDPFVGGAANGITYNGTFWTAVGNNSDLNVSSATSTDGLTWVPSVTNALLYGNDIAWNGNIFVMVGTNTETVVTSTDGLNWTASTNNPFTTTGQGFGIKWNGTYWLAVGTSPNNDITIAKSSNGLDWTSVTTDPFLGGTCIDVAWNGTYWVAVGTNGVAGTVYIAVSTDGLDWTTCPNNPATIGGASSQITGIAWNGRYWIANGYIYDAAIGAIGGMMISADGINWTKPKNTTFNFTATTLHTVRVANKQYTAP